MRPRFYQSTLGLLLLLPSVCIGQIDDPESPEVFAQQLVKAINSNDIGRRKAILHAKSRECATAKTQPYFDWIFSRQLKYTIPTDYKVTTAKFPQDDSRKAEISATYPVPPGHQLQIDFNTGIESSATIVVLVAHDGQRWREVLPCPQPETAVGARNSDMQRSSQEQRATELAEQLTDPLRGEIMTLAQSGNRVDAIRKYADASGESLIVAKRVVDLVAPR